MTSTQFTNRFPEDEPQAEHERVTAYWEWLENNVSPDNSRPVFRIGNNTWKRLHTPEDADFEARHMRHSIGHSWDKYSAFGYIFSLRAADNTPQATILVRGNDVVHAREHCNARLSEESMSALRTFCFYAGFVIVPDEHPFEVWTGDEENTCITYMRRTSHGKEFTSLVLPGGISEQEIHTMTSCGSALFTPADAGLPGEGVHELVSVGSTEKEADVGVSADTFCRVWSTGTKYV